MGLSPGIPALDAAAQEGKLFIVCHIHTCGETGVNDLLATNPQPDLYREYGLRAGGVPGSKSRRQLGGGVPETETGNGACHEAGGHTHKRAAPRDRSGASSGPGTGVDEQLDQPNEPIGDLKCDHVQAIPTLPLAHSPNEEPGDRWANSAKTREKSASSCKVQGHKSVVPEVRVTLGLLAR